MIKSTYLKRKHLGIIVILITLFLLVGYVVGEMLYSKTEFMGAKEEIRTLVAKLPALTTPSFTELEMIGRMIIYDGWLAIEVRDIESTIEQIQRITQEMGGFISQMSVSKDDKVKSASLTLRIPQANFYITMQHISQLGELKDKKVSSQDVTERYIDLEARLKNAQREEQHLLQLFDKAQKVDEMLSIERELNRVREQIELYTSQLKYLERRVEYATITVSLSEPSPPTPWIPEFKWDIPIKMGFQILLTIIQGLIVILFVLIPISMVSAPTYYLYKRRKKRDVQQK